MTFPHFVRRAHLYTGLFLLPWVIMFGVSTIPINHQAPDPGTANWTRIGERAFDAPVPAAEDNLRPLGRDIMNAAGIEGGYYVYRAKPRQILVGHPHFLAPVRVNYFPDEKRLVIERRSFSLRPFLSSMHTRGGYDMGGFWDSVWAVFVDALCIGLILWIASGIYMWWGLPSTRRWGWLALSAGALCFVLIIATL
ncbi:MAG TPA: hypothetical protein VM115_01255 [Vicinamibacterales bacterium]|nr:hypothetical protein [Vicinamibacterales bacterium]